MYIDLRVCDRFVDVVTEGRKEVTICIGDELPEELSD